VCLSCLKSKVFITKKGFHNLQSSLESYCSFIFTENGNIREETNVLRIFDMKMVRKIYGPI
jgi:hypothetical protein